MIYGLEWRHPAIILFVLNLVLGGWAVYLEGVLIPETVALATRGLPWPLLLIGLLGISWAPLYMIARPHDWLPNRRLLVDETTARARRSAVQWMGYTLSVIWLGFILFRLSQML